MSAKSAIVLPGQLRAAMDGCKKKKKESNDYY